MSRRKQGKPQQRKTIDSLDPEADHDTLTCGACQTVFPLADIVKFIQHKINRCNKENIGPYEEPNGFDDEETNEQDVMTVINNRRPSISAPITSRRSPDKHLPSSPRPSEDSLSDLPLGDETNCTKYDTKEDEDSGEEDSLFNEKKMYHRQLDRKGKVTEVGVNTTVTEPFRFICGTCKSLFNSAWNLVQHAQKAHSFKIYMEPSLAELEGHQKKEKSVSIPGTPKLKSDKDTRPSTRSPAPKKSSSPGPPAGVHEAFAPPHAPFMFHMHDRPPLSPALGPPGPFHRPPGDFRMEFRMDLDPFQRIPGIPGLGIHRPPFEHPGLPPSYPYTFKRHPPVPEPPSAVPAQSSSAEDFYSQRLRQLAHPGPPSSPSDSPSPGQKSGSGIRPQQSNSSAFSPSTTQAPASSSSNGSTEAISLRTPQLLPPKQKACEFCGKNFRFESNLIVHRRSHTGDKPFRCPLCPHACTQASKLKRHMKIHKKTGSNSTFGSNMDQNPCSPTRTPDSTRLSRPEESFEYDESDMERQVEDDDENAALEEEMAMAELSKAQEDSNHALQLTVFEDNEEKSSMDVNDEDMIDEDGIDEDNELLDDECDSSSGINQNETLRKSSLLSEVMENSGLKDISEYNEAFRQALKDQNVQGNFKFDSPLCKVEIAQNGFAEEQGQAADSSRLGLDQMCDSSSECSAKKMKLEPIEIIPRDNNPFQRPESLYSNPIWFPPTAMPPELFMRHPVHGDGHLMPRPHPLHHHNGGSLLNHNSAFKINSTRKHGTNNYGQLNSLPTTAASSPSVPVVKRRNDTCEFCGKIFKNCSNLTVHRRSHTGEKPYKCQLCSYACAQSSKLTRHMRTHGRLGKDVYRCKFCGMPFSVPSTLEKHMRKCVGNQPSSILDHEKSNSGISPTGMSPVGMSPVGSGLSPIGSLPTGDTLEKHMRECVGNQPTTLLDHEKNNSEISPTGMSPAGISSVGSGLSPVGSLPTGDTLEKHMRECVGNQPSSLLDHEKSNSEISPTGMSPAEISSVGSGHSPIGSLPVGNSLEKNTRECVANQPSTLLDREKSSSEISPTGMSPAGISSVGSGHSPIGSLPVGNSLEKNMKECLGNQPSSLLDHIKKSNSGISPTGMSPVGISSVGSGHSHIGSTPVRSSLEKNTRECVGNQPSSLLDHEKSNSGISLTGMSPVGISPIGSGHSPVGSLPTSSGGVFSPPSSGVPSPTSGTMASSGASQQAKPNMMDIDTPTSGTMASSGASQQVKPNMMDLDNGMSPAMSVKSGHSPQLTSRTFALPSSGIPSPTSGTLPLPTVIPTPTSGTLPLPSSGALP